MNGRDQAEASVKMRDFMAENTSSIVVRKRGDLVVKSRNKGDGNSLRFRSVFQREGRIEEDLRGARPFRLQLRIFEK